MTLVPAPANAPLGKETVYPACGQGTLLLYPIIRDGNVTGHERRCSFCHKGEGSG